MSLKQDLLDPEQAKAYYRLDSIEGRLADLDKKYRHLLPNRQAWQNAVRSDQARAARRIDKLVEELRLARIEMNDSRRLMTIVTAPWKREAKIRKAENDRRRKIRTQSQRRADRKAEKAMKAGEIGIVAGCSDAVATRALVAAAAQTFLSVGAITKDTFRRAINEGWSPERLMQEAT